MTRLPTRLQEDSHQYEDHKQECEKGLNDGVPHNANNLEAIESKEEDYNQKR